jgi:ketosteroid isomerase-like protein
VQLKNFYQVKIFLDRISEIIEPVTIVLSGDLQFELTLVKKTMRVRNSFLVALFILTCGRSFAQADSLQKQINEQVWKTFIRSFNDNDDEGFKSVHSKDIIRVTQDDKQIFGYEQYFRPVPESEKAKWAKWRKNIELRFIQRIAANDKAFEVGYYKSTSTNTTTGESRTGYGKFHVLLRREKGLWKILMDADAHEKTDEAVFMQGKPLE